MARSPKISKIGEFDGLPDQGGAPPDGGLAVGPAHIISGGNSAFTITPKNTLVPAAVVQYSTFFTGENQTGVDGLFDPRVEYDPTTDRYMMLILGLDDTNRRSQVLFAVSQTNDPTGNWHRYAFDVKESEGGMDRWLDYASLGFTSDAIVFNGTMFSFPKATAGGSLHATLRILDKAKALAGQPLTPTTLSKFNSNVAPENTIQPVLTYDPGVTTQYMLSAATDGQVNFFQISNLLATNPTVKFTPLSVDSWLTPPAMAQSGSAVTLDGGDTRMLNAVMRNGQIWATHGIGLNIGGTVRGVARVYRVNPVGDGSVAQTFSVSDPVLNLHYPSLDLDGSDNVLLGYSTANSGSAASQAVSLKKTTDANFSAPLIVTPGVAGYKHEGADSNRWGDYSDTQFDPSDPTRVWHLGMVAATTGTWKLRVVSIRTVDESIVVTSPNGGETLRVGTPHTITWNATGFGTPGNVKIELSPDGGANFPEVISASTPNSGTFAFTPTGPITSTARIRVSHLTLTSISDSSDANFSVQDGSLTVQKPAMGDSVNVGSTATINWTATGLAQTGATNVLIEISRDGGANFSTLIASTANDGTENFTVTGPATTQAKIRVTTISVGGTFSGVSGAFTIKEPGVVTVVAPNGGEQILAAAMTSIQWTSSGFTGNVIISISRDGGATFTPLVSDTDNDGEELVELGGPATTSARIRVASINDTAAIDDSNANFTVLTQSIEITAPRLGSEVLVGSKFNVTWTTNGIDAGDTVTIELSRDGGKTFTALAARTPNDGNQQVELNAPTTDNAVIRITWDRNTAVKDMSPAFSIAPPSVRLTSPNGGEKWTLGSKQDITWAGPILGNGTVTIELSYDGGRTFARTLARGVKNDGSLSVKVIGALTKKAVIRIRWDRSAAVADLSNAVFEIARR